MKVVAVKKNLLDGCAVPQDPHYARAYRVWGKNPPRVMVEGEPESPCAYCSRPTDFGGPPPYMSHGVAWLRDLRPCVCGEWHYCCYSCVKRLGIAPAWRLKRGPDRHVVGTQTCPLALRVAHEFMGIDVDEGAVVANTQKLKARWMLSKAARPGADG